MYVAKQKVCNYSGYREGVKLMCEICLGGGCSACEPTNDELQFASMKEIEEFYNIHGEDMYVDPGELDLEDIEDFLDE